MTYSVNGIEKLRADSASFVLREALTTLVEILTIPDEDFVDDDFEDFFGVDDMATNGLIIPDGFIGR